MLLIKYCSSMAKVFYLPFTNIATYFLVLVVLKIEIWLFNYSTNEREFGERGERT